MAINEELTRFVRESLARGISRTEIQDVLSRSGWNEAQVNAALSEFSEIEFAIPIPKPKPYISARDTFLYLVLFSTLYSCIFNFGSFVFEIINHFVPETEFHIATKQSFAESIRWSVSSLTIALPIFLLVSRHLNRETKNNPYVQHSKVRKWLTYITLYLASGTLMCDLTVIVFNFLGGGSKLRFLFKAVIIAIIAVIVFTHYLREMRKIEKISSEGLGQTET